jgi:GT2 family glycosyltransferase
MISLLVVNYHSAALAAEAIRSARASSSAPLHVVAVDNSLDGGEASRLRPHADVLVVADRNAGYAGGINLGRPHCRGEIVVVSNPDVVFGEKAVDLLAAALTDGRFAVAGPAFFWDAAHRWQLPPADEQTLGGKIDEAMASRWSWWMRRRDRRRIRGRAAFWSLREVTPVAALSGAVMAIRLTDLDAAGGFDERFALYFEENDFLRRLRRTGRGVAYVPAARCRHIYDQSAGGARAQASSAYGASELSYFEKWYGRSLTTLVMRFARELPSRVEAAECAALRLPRPGLLVEVSPLSSFNTAAGLFRAEGEVDVPPEVWESFRGGQLFLRAVDPATAETVGACVRTRR